MSKVVIFSGAPGVGKSTLSYQLAQKTGWAFLSKDAIDRALEKEKIVNGRAGYAVLLTLAELNLKNNVSVILDSVFTFDSLRQQIRVISKSTHAQLHFIVCTCSDEKVWKQRVDERPEMVAGWTPADWSEVQRVQQQYEKWSVPHLLLDSVDPLDENFQKLLSYIGE